MVIQLLELAWPLSKEGQEDMQDCDPHMAESGRGVLFALPTVVIERVQHFDFRRIVSGTRYSLLCSLEANLCLVAICRIRTNVVTWYPYDFTKGGILCTKNGGCAYI